jgi:hypothetical protein
MSSPERVRRALAFQNPDRVPISHAVLPAAQLKYGRALDEILAEFREDFGWDDRWIELPYEGLHFADDWGGQRGLLIRPEQWRRLFKPRYAEMFRRVKQAKMHVWFHSDGRINDILGDLIEIGPDVPLANIRAMYEAFREYGSGQMGEDAPRHTGQEPCLPALGEQEEAHAI